MIRQHPARGLWEARYVGADGRKHSLYALSRKAAQERLRAALTDADRGIQPVVTRLGAMPLRGAVESLAARAGIPLGPADGRTGPDGSEAALREMESSSPTQASRPRGAGPAPRGRYDLTPREREVLVLVVAGSSDGEIAEALFISKKTASFHVAMIKGKLGARSRVEIATDAIGLGLIEAPPPRPT